MNLTSIAQHLVNQLACTRDVACRQILQTLAETGQPLAPQHLAALLDMSQDELSAHLARIPDTEFDEQGNIIGWAITLRSTSHQFTVQERPLSTWCAFDTVFFPPLLQVEAQVHSVCAQTGLPISFVSTPTGIQDLTPTTSMLSLILSTEQCESVRGSFCHQSLFFASPEAASAFQSVHRDALLLSLEEAVYVGQAVASSFLALPAL